MNVSSPASKIGTFIWAPKHGMVVFFKAPEKILITFQ
jgi:hypothetical protein